MKLQNMTIIFVIIIIPIIVVMSYYIGLQIDTITMQNSYNTKLQEASKDAIEALEINTVEWNITPSTSASAKRRDVEGSINTFATALANSLGIGGAGLERIQSYIPVLLYTMYDGYYLYTPEGLNGEKLLRPYSPYSARYVQGTTDITVNYTLDNYIRVYGMVNGEYQTRGGYLVVCDFDKGVQKVSGGELIPEKINNIKYVGRKILPEILTEQVCIYEGSTDTYNIDTYQYVYDKDNNKVYWDGSAYFKVSKTHIKEPLSVYNADPNAFYANTFRKISIPIKDVNNEWQELKVYQALNPGGTDKFFEDNDADGNLALIGADFETIIGSCGYNLTGDCLTKDFSAINYCVESYVFTKWVNTYLGNIKVSNFKGEVGQYNNVEDVNIFIINNDDNNPDPEANSDYQSSPLAIHKKDVIINKLEKNLARAVEVAKNQSYDYRLPKLTYSEWEQALSNISLISYMQGMQIGLKYYNNYAIATSTLNREYVDPHELYFSCTDGTDEYYHQRDCEKIEGNIYVGYRSVDYLAKSYNNGTEDKYYYLHDNSGDKNSELECYSCLVNHSTYKQKNDGTKDIRETEYYNALARERYIQLDSPKTGVELSEIELAKNVYKNNTLINNGKVKPGDKVKYEIIVKNVGFADDIIYMIDYFPWYYDGTTGKNKIKNISTVNITSNIEGRTANDIINSSDIDYGFESLETERNKQMGISFSKLSIKKNEEIKITFEAEIDSIAMVPIGSDWLKNEVVVYSTGLEQTKVIDATVGNTVEQEIKLATKDVSGTIFNIVMVMDYSWSEFGNVIDETLQNAKKAFLDTIETNLSGARVHVSYVTFGSTINRIENILTDICAENSFSSLKNQNLFDLSITGGTNYYDAFKEANTQLNNFRNSLSNEEKARCRNLVVFMADGAPTPCAFTIIGNQVQESIMDWFNGETEQKIQKLENEIAELKGKLNWLNVAIIGPQILIKEGELAALKLAPTNFASSIINVLMDAIFKVGDIGAGAIDTITSSWLELAMTGEEQYAWKVLLLRLPEILLNWIPGLQVDTWIGSGIFGQIPKLVWDQILEQVNLIKSVPNTEIYSTLVADSETSGYGVKKTSSYFEKQAAGEEYEKYYGYLTDASKLPERFKDIANGWGITESGDKAESIGGEVTLSNYSKIKSILIGTTEITKIDAEDKEYLKQTGTDEGVLDLKKLAQHRYDLTLDITVKYET